MRTKALHSLDVEDVDDEKKALLLCHRPGYGWILKNGKPGGRMFAIIDGTYQLLTDWISLTRPNVEGDGIEPLFATTKFTWDMFTYLCLFANRQWLLNFCSQIKHLSELFDPLYIVY